MYILNEKDYIRGVLASKKKPNDLPMGYFIMLIAKYYFNNGEAFEDLIEIVKNKLLEFNIENYQEYKWSNKIVKTCKFLYESEDNSKFKELEYIPIYQKEINLISTLPNDRQKKFMFTLYAIARYMDSDGWINKKDLRGLSEVFKLANVTLTLEKKNEMLHELYANGYISFGKKIDNLNIKVNLCSGADEEVAYKLTDFTNIGNQYIGNFKKGYKQCKCCGKKIRDTGSRKKYCDKCAYDIKLKQNIGYYYEKLNV